MRAVVSLAAFAHSREVMLRWPHEHRLLQRWLGDAILDEVQHMIGARFDDIALLHVAAHIVCPVLIVHGTRDATVPVRDAERLLGTTAHGAMPTIEADRDLRAALAPQAAQVVRLLSTHLIETRDPSAP